MPGCTLTTLEINAGIGGFDRVDTERVVLDVRDSSRVLEKIQSLRSGHSGRVCVVAKHLCGAATDALLQTLASTSVDAILIAPCCHSKIQYLEERRLEGLESKRRNKQKLQVRSNILPPPLPLNHLWDHLPSLQCPRIFCHVNTLCAPLVSVHGRDTCETSLHTVHTHNLC